MRPIHLVHFDEVRPSVILTRETSSDHMRRITVAQITSRIHGLPVEVRVGPMNGLDEESVVNADSIYTLTQDRIGRRIGWLFDDQEDELTRAIAYAFNLEIYED
jgi:mRNA interferase MazF